MKRTIDISSYLIGTFKARFVRNNWRFDCPFCNDTKGHFGVSLSKGLVGCFKCDYRGTVINFLCDYESKSVTEIYRMLSSYPRLVLPIRRREPRKASRFELSSIGYVPLWLPTTERLGSLGKAYLKKRGFNKQRRKNWRLGYANGDSYFGRIIVPFYEDGRLVYFVARKFMGGGPKYRNPTAEEIGLGSGEVVFNLDRASLQDEVNICEGVFDAMAIEDGKSSVAIVGKKLTNTQMEKILMSGFRSVTITLDSDAEEYAYELAEKFHTILPTFIRVLPQGDPAELGDAVLKHLPAPVSLRSITSFRMTQQRGRRKKRAPVPHRPR